MPQVFVRGGQGARLRVPAQREGETRDQEGALEQQKMLWHNYMYISCCNKLRSMSNFAKRPIPAFLAGERDIEQQRTTFCC